MDVIGDISAFDDWDSYWDSYQARRNVQNIGGATLYFGQFLSDFQNSFILWKLLTGPIIGGRQAAPPISAGPDNISQSLP